MVLWFCSLNRTSSSREFVRASARLGCFERVHRRAVVVAERARGTPKAARPVSKTNVSRSQKILSSVIPAAVKRSTTLSTIPHVIGLTNPSGGGGEYAELILRIWATSVGSPGIQLPMMIRPPGRVTRTISLATSNGRGREHRAEDAHDEIERLVVQVGEVARVPFLKRQVREALFLGPTVPGLDEVSAQCRRRALGPEPSGGNGRGPVATAEVQHLESLGDADRSTSASPLSRMLAAMRVKSPFSHSALFGFIRSVSSRAGSAVGSC